MFVDPFGPDGIPGTNDDNLRLAANSPAIDAGDPAFVPDASETDFDGHPRMRCGRVDMGAFEFNDADANCDSLIDLSDYLDWPACLTGPGVPWREQRCAPFDLGRNGQVELSDFSDFQNSFGH